MTLYPHNQQAYEAVMKHFGEGNRKAAVVQPTGTGKSYMGGAVASHFEKVLVVAPNEYVYGQAIVTTPLLTLSTSVRIASSTSAKVILSPIGSSSAARRNRFM